MRPRHGLATRWGYHGHWPGHGVGLAALVVRDGKTVDVLECEGGHIDFAPHDEREIGLLRALLPKYGRVSAERIVSGPALRNILFALTGDERLDLDDRELWKRARAGDATMAEALDLLLANFGSVAGDFALAHGADGVVLAGGMTKRIASLIPQSRFAERFAAKGRFRERMEAVPVKLLTHPSPGLLGAAAALARRD